jgi:uncharacterized membrane protein
MGKNLVLLLIFILVLLPSVQGATIQGTVYDWYALEPLRDVIIEVNSTPPQQVVAKDGSYSLNLPEGDYTIKAKYYRYGVLEYYAEENLTVREAGSFTLDLIMLPALEEEKIFSPEVLQVDDLVANEKSQLQSLYSWLVLFLGVSLVLFILLRGRKKMERIPEEDDLPDDLKELLQLLKERGGRMTQAELRKNFTYSEAKVSLMLTDLESRGLIRKIKKGRGNIIIIV